VTRSAQEPPHTWLGEAQFKVQVPLLHDEPAAH